MVAKLVKNQFIPKKNTKIKIKKLIGVLLDNSQKVKWGGG